MYKVYKQQGSGCGAVGRAVASNIRESSHSQFYLLLTLLVKLHIKRKIKKKRPGMAEFKRAEQKKMSIRISINSISWIRSKPFAKRFLVYLTSSSSSSSCCRSAAILEFLRAASNHQQVPLGNHHIVHRALMTFPKWRLIWRCPILNDWLKIFYAISVSND